VISILRQAPDNRAPALAGLTGHGGAFAALALPYAAVAVWLLRSRVQGYIARNPGSSPNR
jgi:hypothetical protein